MAIVVLLTLLETENFNFWHCSRGYLYILIVYSAPLLPVLWFLLGCGCMTSIIFTIT